MRQVSPSSGDKQRQVRGRNKPAATGKIPKRAAQRIRETAGKLFYREGIRAVGVDEIVSQAGVTKPSLYRSFASKDELAADYLRHHGEERLAAFDAAFVTGKDLRAGLRRWLADIAERANRPDARGCGNSNAVVEYPHTKHPARQAAVSIKRQFRLRYRRLAAALGAHEPAVLGDMLQMAIEGAYMSGQIFGPGSPARHLVVIADLIIDGYLAQQKKPATSHKTAQRTGRTPK